MASQNSVFPLTQDVELPDRESRTVALFTDEGSEILDALGSETARAILEALSEETGTTSELAERLDTTIQTIHYHLQRLEDAGLVRVVDTHYSARGCEMDVFAPANDPLVLVDAEEPDIDSQLGPLSNAM